MWPGDVRWCSGRVVQNRLRPSRGPARAQDISQRASDGPEAVFRVPGRSRVAIIAYARRVWPSAAFAGVGLSSPVQSSPASNEPEVEGKPRDLHVTPDPLLPGCSCRRHNTLQSLFFSPSIPSSGKNSSCWLATLNQLATSSSRLSAKACDNLLNNSRSHHPRQQVAINLTIAIRRSPKPRDILPEWSVPTKPGWLYQASRSTAPALHHARFL